MRKTLTVLLPVCIAMALHAAPNGRDIMKKSQDATKLDGMESVAVLIIRDAKGNQRVRKFSTALKKYGEVTKTIMKFIEPADVKGTGILTIDNDTKDDDMWLYMPGLRKTRRIVSSEKTKSFMGSEFSNADITTPTFDDFTYKLLGEEKVSGMDCWKLEIVPKSENIADDNGYSKKIAWINKSDNVTRKTEMYDLDGELIKVISVSKVQLLDEKKGKYQSTDVEIKNIQNKRSSQFKLEKVIFNPDVKDEYFTTQFLEK